jgi:hypothetical protein
MTESYAERLIRSHRNTLTATATADEFHDHREALNQKLRAVSVLGAEEQSHRVHGRGLTEEEFRRVLRLYPGDVPSQRP